MSQYTAEYLQEKLTKELEAVHCEVEDLGGCAGGKFSALIISPKFEGKKLIERQRLVNEILKEELTQIHAFQFKKTKTPEEWAKLNNQ